MRDEITLELSNFSFQDQHSNRTAARSPQVNLGVVSSRIVVPHRCPASFVPHRSEADPRTVCLLLECRAPIKRARVARTILFLPSRPDAPLGSIALHRAESVAGSFGLRARASALVERRHPLRRQPARFVLGSRYVAPTLGHYNLTRVPRRRGNRIQAGRHSSTNTHRATAGNCRVYSRS
jgi:hypothetical protein